MEQLTVSALWPELDHTLAAPLLAGATYPWEILKKIKDFILELGATLPADEYDQVSEGVWVAKDATVAPSAYLGAPCIIGHGTEVRHCAYIR
ncbi:MAG: UDP-N-acetylglucosamine pyrophosphorylase, partial [Clostridia bacterium]|nr:UDP-N-acetylglucosamine pyrophosphorylase [Clostridia bacterium]